MVSGRSTHYYSRSLVHFANVKHRIKKALKSHPHADANIFLTFSHSSVGLSRAPAVQICDWTYEYYFKHFEGRKPDLLERRSVRREDNLIEHSDLVIPLFPGVAEHMRRRYSNRNICYLGNAANSLCEPLEQGLALDKKSGSDALLFVGNRNYLEGARCLIAAFELLRKEHRELSLHLVGLDPGDFAGLPEGVICHGYLDKGVASDRELYYSLLQSARILINTTPKWAAFSSTLEAMHHYTPVIVSPYAEFVRMFGSDIQFGRYCAEGKPEALSQAIRATLADPCYLSLCVAANHAASVHTWSAFVDGLLELVDPLIVGDRCMPERS
jgi:glycosyltransferase involved in cell wall biosynthesis